MAAHYSTYQHTYQDNGAYIQAVNTWGNHMSKYQIAVRTSASVEYRLATQTAAIRSNKH